MVGSDNLRLSWYLNPHSPSPREKEFFISAIGCLLLLLSQWSQHWELLGLSFLIVGVSLSVVRCVLHYASLSQRRSVLPYLGWVYSCQEREREM